MKQHRAASKHRQPNGEHPQSPDASSALRCDGTYLWKISNISQMLSTYPMHSGRNRNQLTLRRNSTEMLLNYCWISFCLTGSAHPNDGLPLHSEPFFSSREGYKLQVRAYLNGDGAARGTHISLHLRLLPGPNDNQLAFPFTDHVTFHLFDQSRGKDHVTKSIIPNMLQKSQFEMDTTTGVSRFLPVSMIQQPNNPYIKDDAMLIKIVIGLANVPEKLLPLASMLDHRLPAHVQRTMIANEIQRQVEHQTIKEEKESLEIRNEVLAIQNRILQTRLAQAAHDMEQLRTIISEDRRPNVDLIPSGVEADLILVYVDYNRWIDTLTCG